MSNRICKMLKINFPIIQGGMGNISNATLTAAVSEAGGLGTIGSGTMTPEKVREIIVETKQKTDKPFAVNIAISVVLTPTYGYIGVAIAAMTAAWLNALLLAWGLYRRKYLVIDGRFAKFLPRLVLSVVLMGGIVWGVINVLWPGDAAPVWHQVAALVAIIAVGGASFAASALLLRATSLADLRNLRR